MDPKKVAATRGMARHAATAIGAVLVALGLLDGGAVDSLVANVDKFIEHLSTLIGIAMTVWAVVDSVREKYKAKSAPDA